MAVATANSIQFTAKVMAAGVAMCQNTCLCNWNVDLQPLVWLVSPLRGGIFFGEDLMPYI